MPERALRWRYLTKGDRFLQQLVALRRQQVERALELYRRAVMDLAVQHVLYGT